METSQSQTEIARLRAEREARGRDLDRIHARMAELAAGAREEVANERWLLRDEEGAAIGLLTLAAADLSDAEGWAAGAE